MLKMERAADAWRHNSGWPSIVRTAWLFWRSTACFDARLLPWTCGRGRAEACCFLLQQPQLVGGLHSAACWAEFQQWRQARRPAARIDTVEAFRSQWPLLFQSYLVERGLLL